MQLGREIGRGLRSVVYEFGDDEAAKVPNRDVPPAWLCEELRLTRAVARAGAPVPHGGRIERIGELDALVVERVHGPSMWDRLIADPSAATELAGVLAGAQVGLARLPTSVELPSQRDRIVSKIRRVVAEHGDDLGAALDLIPHDDGPLGVCHGDLHPRNVLLSPDGPLLVDWFDASRGVMAAEIARTSVVLEDSDELGAGTQGAAMIAEFCDRYRSIACELSGVDPELVDRWVVVQSVARLAEGFGRRRLPELRRRVAGA